MATESDILEAMKQVEDPELGVNVVDLGVLEPARVPGLLVVVEDDLLVEVVEGHVGVLA